MPPTWRATSPPTNNGGPAADLDNITVLEVPLNTVWIRDYGPNTVYGNGVDDRIIVDWLYNRPRPDDDVVSAGHRRPHGALTSTRPQPADPTTS